MRLLTPLMIDGPTDWQGVELVRGTSIPFTSLFHDAPTHVGAMPVLVLMLVDCSFFLLGCSRFPFSVGTT